METTLFALRGKDVRAVEVHGQTHFILADVARITGIKHSQNAAKLLPASHVIRITSRNARRHGLKELFSSWPGKSMVLVNSRGAARLAARAQDPILCEFFENVDFPFSTPEALATEPENVQEDYENLVDLFCTLRRDLNCIIERVIALENRTEPAVVDDEEHLTTPNYIRKYQGGIDIGPAFRQFTAICHNTMRANHLEPKNHGIYPAFPLSVLNIAWEELGV